MAQGSGIPKQRASFYGYGTGKMPANMGPGKPVPIAKRDYKTQTPTYMNTAVTHQGVALKSGR
jgi:hypothetical protein